MCNMKRIILLFSVTALAACLANAQPAKRRNTTAASTTQNASVQKKGTDRASMQFPTSASMPEDVVWKRDIYRQLDLTKDKNAPLYYPVEPQGKQVNLFTYLFRLILTGRIPAYTYQLDGNESFEAKDKLAVKDMLERYGIYYEEKDGKIQVADSDVPSGEATRYYLKESVYLDQRTGTFSTKVTALCPVLMRGADEFSTEATPYPLFWVQYSDVAPWLSRLPVMGSNLNNVTNMTADDYFTMSRYEGKIYKTNNLQGRVLATYCKTDSAMSKEQKKIEQQLTDFEEIVWGHRKDSTDSVSLAKEKPEKVKRTSSRKDSSVQAGSSRRRKTENSQESKQKSESTAPRVSARRQRR